MRLWLILMGVILMSVIGGSNAFAISSEQIFTRVLINNVQRCYQNAFAPSIGALQYGGFNTLMNDGYKQSNTTTHAFLIPAIKDNYNNMTTSDGNPATAGGRITTCYALFAGDATGLNTLPGSMKGLFDIYGVTVPGSNGNIDALNQFMNGKLQYAIDAEQASQEEYCYTAYAREKTTAAQEVNLGSFCNNADNYPLRAQNIVFSNGAENAGYTVTTSSALSSNSYEDYDKFKLTITSKSAQCYDGNTGMEKCSASVLLPISAPEEGATNISTGAYWPNAPALRVKIEKRQSSAEGSKKVTYSKGTGDAWKSVIGAITNGVYNDKVPFTDADKYDLYSQYLKMNFGKNGTPVSSSICQTTKPSVLADPGAMTYYIYIKGSGWCQANLDENRLNSKPVMTVFSRNERYVLDSTVNDLTGLINLMGTLDYSNDEDLADVDNPGAANPTQGDVDPGSVNQNCANSGGAASLGWIVCPIIEWMGHAAEDAYSQYVEPSLNIPPRLFSGGNEGVRSAWGTFRNIANLAFIILLIAVIFSQLTGVGIDNYGIKKVLPKLIIAAIFVNLSYLLCLMAVDLSNILGNGLRMLFDGLSQGLSVPTHIGITDTLDGINVEEVGSTMITGVALLAALIGMAGSIWANPAVILSLLVSALGVVIAIFFIFILLTAREAAVVVAVALAPVAVICYALPNTKKLFDKWLTLLKALLLVYPICGLLIGGGNYVSNLLLSSGFGSDGFVSALTAMLVGVLPIFFIPMVLRGSFAAMGNLGARISGFGDRLRRGTTGRIRSSEIYKREQERGTERQTRWRAGIRSDGSEKNVSEFGRLIRGGKRGMARSRAQYLKNRDTENREDSLMGTGFTAAQIGLQKKAEADEVLDYMTLVNNDTRNGADEDKLLEMFRDYEKQGNKAGMIACTRIAGRRKDTASRFIANTLMSGGVETGETDIDGRPKLRPYRADLMRSVAKEMAEGQTAANYRSATPFGFEYASRLNQGNAYKGMVDKLDENGNVVLDRKGNVVKEGVNAESYADWIKYNDNIHNTINRHVTTASELMGIQNTNLGDMVKMINSHEISGVDEAQLRTLASEVIRTNQENGSQIDVTKVENIYKLAYGNNYASEMSKAGLAGFITNTNDGSVQTAPSGAAREGEILNVRGDNSQNQIIIDSTGEQARQAMREFDASQRGNRNWPGNQRG